MQAVPESAIVVTSRHGQQYQCTYPSTVEQEKQKEEKEKEALEKGVIQLLNPIGIGPCLVKVIYLKLTEIFVVCNDMCVVQKF